MDQANSTDGRIDQKDSATDPLTLDRDDPVREAIERLEARVAALEGDEDDGADSLTTCPNCGIRHEVGTACNDDEPTLDLSMVTGDLADGESVKRTIDAHAGGPTP